MNLLYKYMLFCAVILTITPIILSTFASDKITATDWIYRHSVWIQDYMHGDLTPLTYYTPLFHWMLLPFVAINFPMKYFQIIFSMMSICSILYMTYKFESEKTLLYASFLLATSIAYVEFAGSLMPQALDYFFFPMIVFFYFRERVKIFVPLLFFLFFTHVTGLIFIGILFLHSLFTKRCKYAKILLVMMLIVLPFFYFYNIMPKDYAFIWDWKAQAEWEAQYTNPFWNFFGFSGFLTWILLPYVVYKYYKKKKLTEMQLLYAIWFFGFVPLALMGLGIWRFISYAIVPLSLFVASLIGKDDKNSINDKNEIEKRFIDAFGDEK